MPEALRAPTGAGHAVLRVRNLTKRYGETQALRGVDLTGRAGEVHAVVGENGAGKSTLMRLLAGADRPDFGDIELGGQEVRLTSPLEGRRAGVCAVYQEFSLVPHLTVWENLLLSSMASAGGLRMRPRELRARARALLEQLGFELDVNVRVDELSVSQRQMVEIAKGVVEDPQVLILDEPSAVLSREELAKVFALVRQLAASGTLILYVSHRLDEIFAIADRITVLKDGKDVVTLTPAETDERQLINLMVGRDVEDVFPPRDTSQVGDEVLVVEGLARPPRLVNASLRLRAGEVVGVFGLVGSGRTELSRAIFGAEPATDGTMWLRGEPFSPRSPADALAAGVAYLTEDRGRDGLVLHDSVGMNMTLAVLRNASRFGFVRMQHESDLIDRQIKALAVRTTDADAPVQQLSGGNQQKVLLARCLLTDAQVLLLDEPTRGVDVATRIEIYRHIAELAARGVAVLLTSSELVEILGLSHRVLVMRHGSIVAELPASEATEENLLAAAAGVAA